MIERLDGMCKVKRKRYAADFKAKVAESSNLVWSNNR